MAVVGVGKGKKSKYMIGREQGGETLEEALEKTKERGTSRRSWGGTNVIAYRPLPCRPLRPRAQPLTRPCHLHAHESGCTAVQPSIRAVGQVGSSWIQEILPGADREKEL